ncbi:hypothetical protein DEA06_06750 [Microbacterium sp. Gd 4-13]|uniref:hypothetical protein n=1 Tax=Microbacterium sp. Gd 4-13 TaxID=2173179 RepID=UPI000D566BC5|nr:hypothetical protein [Microbacterium sp. Gd 4-13]PVW05432.1 hypothetical protein DEA06_06750 [Microbacterium sp. Gd 4-13]
MHPTPTRTPILIEITGSGETAPWWGVPAIAGAFLILGAVLGFWFNRLQDERKATRERSYQWDQNLLSRSSTMITLVRQLNSAAYDHETWTRTYTELAVDQMQRGEPVDPLPVAKPTLSTLSDTFSAFNEEFTTIQLIAPLAVRNAATETYHYATFLMEAQGRQAVEKAARELARSSEELEKAVRAHFGIQ